MSRLILDVTQLAHWQGKLTGIPRVMNELAVRYAKLPESRFIVWDNHNSNFYEVGIVATLQNRGKSLHYLPNSRVETTKNSVGYFIFRAARKLKAAGLPITQRIIDKLQKWEPEHHKVYTPEGKDILFIPWGEWANREYINALKLYHHKGVKLVQFAHDMLPLVTPQFSGHSTESLKQYVEEIYPICALIIANSKHTMRDVGDWMQQQGLEVPPLEFVRLGDDFKKAKPSKPVDEVFIASDLKGDDYILCVGTIEARKNHALLYYVNKLAKQRDIILPKFVIVGRKGWKTEELFETMTNDPEVKDNFVFMQNTGDEELAWLYKHCLFSIYPSFYEGWGLPIAESVAMGVPCISSNTSSMPEIAGSLIDYFSPSSTDECLSAIVRLLDPLELKEAKARVRKYEKTSWESTFERTHALLKDLHGK